MAIPAFIPGLLDLVKKVLPRVLTDKDQELKVGHELEMEVLRAAADTQSEFYGFITAYEGNAADSSRTVQLIRSIIRPLLTVTITGCYLYGWLHPSVFLPAQMELLHFGFIVVLAFWFGERAVKNVAPAVAQMLGKGGTK